MLLLGLDVETTGLDVTEEWIIEIGLVLWDNQLNQPVRIFSELVLEKPDLALSKEIEELTGITTSMLHQFADAPDGRLFDKIDQMVAQADLMVAHNAPFDRGFIEAFYQRWDRQFPQKDWLCTLADVEYPKAIRSKSLIYLAGAHGFANPFAHRAVTDVLTMFKVLSHYPLEPAIKNATSPKLSLIARVTYDERDKAKEQGFRWDGKNKQWKKTVRQVDFKPGELPFEVNVIELT